MSHLTICAEARAADLVQQVLPFLPSTWELTARATAWGALVAAGPGIHVDDTHVIVGQPTRDPHGLPGEPLSLERVAADVCHYGPAALDLVTGPVLVFEIETARVIRHVNGIVPFYSAPGPRWIGSTLAGAAASLRGTSTRAVPVGVVADLASGETMPYTDLPSPEGHSAVTLAGVDREVLNNLSHLRTVPLGTAAKWSNGGGDVMLSRATRHVKSVGDGLAVYVPPLARLGTDAAWTTFLELRDYVVPRLWWYLRRASIWLYAPTFDRPIVDLVAQAVEEPPTG